MQLKSYTLLALSFASIAVAFPAPVAELKRGLILDETTLPRRGLLDGNAGGIGNIVKRPLKMVQKPVEDVLTGLEARGPGLLDTLGDGPLKGVGNQLEKNMKIVTGPLQKIGEIGRAHV